MKREDKVGVKVEITRRITHLTINYNARDWELYGSVKGSEQAARRINRKLEKVLSGAGTRHEAYLLASEVMGKYEKFGATDSEPRGHLADILDRIYGEET